VLERHVAGTDLPRDATVCPECGQAIDRRESDSSLMLGVVLLLAANTVIVAALVLAVVWIVG
jgi:hypothetical protein